MTTIDNHVQTELPPANNKETISEKIKTYWKGCTNPDNARLYGTFQERAALNITQFPKIQGSLLIRMGLVYPLVSSAVEWIGLPKESHSDIMGMTINYHAWVAGYLAYLVEVQSGMGKYAIEGVAKGISKVKELYTRNTTE